MKEVQGMGLVHLPVVHQPAHLLAGWRQLLGADNAVDRLGGAKVMADWADATEALHEDRQLPERAALNEALEATELDDMESGLFDTVVLVEKDGDLAVAFHPCERLDDDSSCIRG